MSMSFTLLGTNISHLGKSQKILSHENIAFESHLEPRKKPSYFPFYWLFNSDSYNPIELGSIITMQPKQLVFFALLEDMTAKSLHAIFDASTGVTYAGGPPSYVMQQPSLPLTSSGKVVGPPEGLGGRAFFLRADSVDNGKHIESHWDGKT